MKKVSYIRRSTDIQEHSIAMQRQMAINSSIKLLKPIDQEFIDDAISGRKTTIDERPALRQMLDEIEQGKISTIYIYKRDRFSRNAMQYLEIYHTLKRHQIEVFFTADNEFPLSYSPVGELIELLMAGIIQREGEQIVERISETIKANFQRGRIPGTLPFGYGYNKTTKEITRNEENLKQVRLIFNLILSNTPLDQIKKNLDDSCIRRNGKAWTTSDIRKTIENSTYMGERILNIRGEQLKNSFDGLSIIDEQSWMQAQDILQELSPVKVRKKHEKPKLLLENLCYCTHCNSPLLPRIRYGSEIVATYSCEQHKRVTVDHRQLEVKVLDQCHNFFNHLIQTNLSKLYERYQTLNKSTLQQNLSIYQGKLRSASQQLNRLTEQWVLLAETDPLKEQLKSDLSKVYHRVSEIEQQIETIHLDLEQIINPDTNALLDLQNTKLFKREIDEASFDEKKSLLSNIVERVQISEMYIEVRFRHPFLTTKEALLHATG